jgi:aldehyde:ferredoxin oxidoreductase
MNPDHYSHLLQAATGLHFTATDLISIGERIYNLERAFNARNGFGRKDDSLPARLLETPLPEGHSKNTVVALDPMLNEYYRLRGWTPEGIPTISTLSEAKLGYISKQIVESCAI